MSASPLRTLVSSRETADSDEDTESPGRVPSRTLEGWLVPGPNTLFRLDRSSASLRSRQVVRVLPVQVCCELEVDESRGEDEGAQRLEPKLPPPTAAATQDGPVHGAAPQTASPTEIATTEEQRDGTVLLSCGLEEGRQCRDLVVGELPSVGGRVVDDAQLAEQLLGDRFDADFVDVGVAVLGKRRPEELPEARPPSSPLTVGEENDSEGECYDHVHGHAERRPPVSVGHVLGAVLP